MSGTCVCRVEASTAAEASPATSAARFARSTPAAEEERTLSASWRRLAWTKSANSAGISEKESTPSIFQRELAPLGLDEIRELGRNLREGEHPIDIPARARDTTSLVFCARTVDADRAEDARSQSSVGQARGCVHVRARKPDADAGELAHV